MHPLTNAPFDEPFLCMLRLREKPKMDIILARSPDFDAVISQESSEGKGDRHKEEPGGVSLAPHLPLCDNEIYMGLNWHGCKMPFYSSPAHPALQQCANAMYGMAIV